MPQNRVQVQLPTRQQDLQPQARPVDRFAPDIDSSKRQLGAALQNLGQSIKGAGTDLAKQMSEDEIKALKPEARILARDYNRFVTFEYAKSNVKDTDDPAVQAQWLADTHQAFFKDRQVNPKVLSLAKPAIDGAMDNISTRLAGDAVTSHYDRMEQSVSTEAQQVVNNYSNMAPEERTQELLNVYSSIVGRGLNPSRARAAIAKEWLARAVTDDNLKMVDELESFKLPNGAKLVDPDVRKQMSDTKEAILNNRWTRQTRFWQLEAKQQEEQTNNLMLRAADKLQSGGGAVSLDEFIEEAIASENSGALTGLRALQSALVGVQNESDPAAFSAAMTAMITDPVMSDPERAPGAIARIVKRFRLSGRDAGDLISEYRRNIAGDSDGNGNKFNRDPVLKNALRVLRDSLTLKDSAGNVVGNTSRWYDADLSYRALMNDYDEKNPEATSEARRSYSSKLLVDLVNQYSRTSRRDVRQDTMQDVEGARRNIKTMYPNARIWEYQDENGEPKLPWEE